MCAAPGVLNYVHIILYIVLLKHFPSLTVIVKFDDSIIFPAGASTTSLIIEVRHFPPFLCYNVRTGLHCGTRDFFKALIVKGMGLEDAGLGMRLHTRRGF